MLPTAQAQEIKLETPEQIEEYVRQASDGAGLNTKRVLALVKCESNFVPQQSQIKANGPNGREDSWGIWQYHLPSHPDMTREQAMNVVFSTSKAIEELKAGKWSKWTCSKKI